MLPIDVCMARRVRPRSCAFTVRRLTLCGRSPESRRSRWHASWVRKVQADCVIEVDSNAYSVPRRLIGERVRVLIAGDQRRISHAGREVAVHQRRTGRFERVVNPAHFDGVVGIGSKARLATAPAPEAIGAGELLRPLIEYERIAGGRW